MNMDVIIPNPSELLLVTGRMEYVARLVAQDARARPFILAIRQWATKKQLPLKRFGWTCLAIGYLQTAGVLGRSPSIPPDSQAPGCDYSMSQHLLRFFEHYLGFDYLSGGVAIAPAPKDAVWQSNSQRKKGVVMLRIADMPLRFYKNRKNDACSTRLKLLTGKPVQGESFQQIIRAFREARQMVMNDQWSNFVADVLLGDVQQKMKETYNSLPKGKTPPPRLAANPLLERQPEGPHREDSTGVVYPEIIADGFNIGGWTKIPRRGGRLKR